MLEERNGETDLSGNGRDQFQEKNQNLCEKEIKKQMQQREDQERSWKMWKASHKNVILKAVVHAVI